MKRIVSLFLAFMLLLSAFPFAVLAEEISQSYSQPCETEDASSVLQEEDSLRVAPSSDATYEESLFLPPVAENRATSGEWEYHTHGNKTTITKYTGYGGSVTIPYTLGGYPVTFIGDHAFRGCTGLTSVTIPDRVTSFGNYAFWDCTGLTSITIPDSVTSIGSGAFSGCTKLTSVTIGNSVTAIGAWAFEGCMGLTSITVAPGNSVYHSTGNCLIETASKALICGCKNSVIPTDGSVTSIDWGAFDGCTGLTSVAIPDSVTSISGAAFRGCTGLTSITIPDSVTSIGDCAFYNCTKLTSITIPDGVTSIYDETFSGCTSLASVTIPGSVTSIRLLAFCNCTSLTSITIPDSVTSIQADAFAGCTGLTSITIPDSVTSIDRGAFDGCTSLTYSTYDNAKYLGNETNPYVVLIKANSTSITSCSIHPNTKLIYHSAFCNCTSLTSITIPDSVTSIQVDAFAGCTGLTSITIPDSVTSIGWSAFSGCTSLKTIQYGGCSREDWNGISIGSNNEVLTSVDRVFHSTHWVTTYTWSEDLASCTASRVCSRCGVTESLTAFSSSVTTPENICVNDWTTTYTASFTNPSFETQVKGVSGQAMGHNYVPVVTPATCTTDGYTTYTCSRCGDSYTADRTFAFDHSWGEPTYTFSVNGKTCTAQRVCKNDASHVETETVNTISSVTKQADCETWGETTFVAFRFNNPVFVGGQTTVLANVRPTGHRWGAVSYTWAPDGDGDTACTASRVCQNDPSHVDSETVKAFGVKIKDPSCATPGEHTYFVGFTNSAFADQTYTTADIPTLDHAWGEVSYTWSDDNKTCTATRICGNDPTHVDTETVNTTFSGDTEITYTATFRNAAFETQTRPVEAFLWGDANGDDKIDNKDIVRLKNYLANYDEDTGVSSNGTTTYEIFPGADANGDGKVDNKDIVRLKNYLANYDEETGVSSNGTTTYILRPAA